MFRWNYKVSKQIRQKQIFSSFNNFTVSHVSCLIFIFVVYTFNNNVA